MSTIGFAWCVIDHIDTTIRHSLKCNVRTCNSKARVCLVPIGEDGCSNGPAELRCLVHTAGASRYFKRRVQRFSYLWRTQIRDGFA